MFELRQRGLEYPHRNRGDDFLADLQAVGLAVTGCARFRSHDFPAQLSGIHRNRHLPLRVARFPGGERQPHRRQRLAFDIAIDFHLHRPRRGVAHREAGLEAIAFAYQRWHAGEQHQVLGGADRCLSGAEQAVTGVRDSDDAESGQRIVERDLHRRPALRIQGDPALPQQQGVEQFAAGFAASSSALWQRFTAIVALANDLHGCGRRVDLDATRLHHCIEQFPGIVGQQFQQAFVHSRDRHFTRFRRLAARALRDLHGDACRFPDLVGFLVRADLDAQFVRLPADADLGHSHPEGRFAEIDQRGRLHAGYPSPNREDRDKDVGRVAALDRNLDHRRGARQGLHEGFDDALAFHGDQRGGLAERHPHLEQGGLAGLVALALRNHVHTVVIALVEPPGVLAGYPGGTVGPGGIAVPIPGLGRHQDVARDRRLHRAVQPAALIRYAIADGFEFFDLGAAFVAVETADQALAIREHFAHVQLRPHLLALDRLPGQVQCEHLELQLILGRGPGVGLDAENDA